MFCTPGSIDLHFHILSISRRAALLLVLHCRSLHFSSLIFWFFSYFLRLFLPRSPDKRARCSLINLRCPPLLPFPFCAALLSSPAIFVPPPARLLLADFNIPSLSHCLRTSASFWHDGLFFFSLFFSLHSFCQGTECRFSGNSVSGKPHFFVRKRTS